VNGLVECRIDELGGGAVEKEGEKRINKA